MTLSEYALKFIGRPYIYGGDGSGKSHGGFDCSGLVLECLYATGMYSGKDLTAQQIHDVLSTKLSWNECVDVRPNDLLFFGKDSEHIVHVAIAIGECLMVEAGGGSSKCKDLKTSTGMVRVRPIRKDVVSILR